MSDQQEWRPHPRQEDFIAIPPTIFEALFGGAAGPGKSEVLIMLPIVTGLFQLPKFKGLLLRRTYPELEKSLILRTQEIYPATGATYNKQLRRWAWPWGSILDFGYAEHEKDVRKYDTTEYTYIGFDELTSFTEFQYKYLSFTRCRSSDLSVPSFVRAATNPGNIGHGWVRERFVEPAREGYKLIVDKSGNKRIFIPALPTDNPYLLRADPGYIKRMEALPEAEKRAKLYGDWWTFEGQAFPFRQEHLPDEPENALHVIKPFDIPQWWPRIMSIDWGWNAMTYSLWGAISPEKRLILYREYACNGRVAEKRKEPRKRISEWTPDIINLSRGENIIAMNIDPSAKQERGDPQTVYDQVAKAFRQDGENLVGINNVSLDLADNGRIGGKTLIQELLRWEQKPRTKHIEGQFDKEYADWLLRNRDPKIYDQYLEAFKEEPPETNLPKVQIFDNLDILIETIPLCVYDEDNPEDVAEFDGDDPYDVFRYISKQYERFFLKGDQAAKELLEKTKILNEFHRTKDYTLLAMRIEQEKAKEGLGKRGGVRISHNLSPLPISSRPIGS